MSLANRLFDRQRFACNAESAAIEVLNQSNYVTADAATSAIPHLLREIHRKPITTAALWARPDQLLALVLEPDTATLQLAVDWDRPCPGGQVDVDLGRTGHLSGPASCAVRSTAMG
jgi:hypothetical protein